MNRHSHLKDIQYSYSDLLGGHRVALALSGSIAALESHRVARLLMRHGAEVQVVMSASACRLVSPMALEWATGFPVITELTAVTEHLLLAGEHAWADLVLVAPATANTLSKIALGIDDTPVTTLATTAIGAGTPLLVAPGMHACMSRHPALAQHFQQLSDWGVGVIPWVEVEGKAKMASADRILAEVCRRLGPGDLAGQRVVITGGPTREYLDPARCLTNPSSGKMACEMARECYRRGAQVTLIYGPGRQPPPEEVEVVKVESTADMAQALSQALEAEVTHYVVAAAAVCDYRPRETSVDKIRTDEGGLSLELEPTPKVIDILRGCPGSPRLIAFKAESGDRERLLGSARKLLTRSRAAAVLANPIDRPEVGFDSDENEFWLLTQDEETHLERRPKAALAREVWDRLLTRDLTSGEERSR